MNPFDVNLDPYKLYNIGTGLAAIDWTQNVLPDVFKNEENDTSFNWKMFSNRLW